MPFNDARIFSRSVACWYFNSITVPPVNSTDRCSPRWNRKNTAATKVNAEITLNTSAWRMNGMSFLMRKNSMSAPELFRHAGHPDGADSDRLQLFLASVPEVDHATRDEHGGEHRGQNTQRVHHGEAADRTGTEHPQRHTDDQGGNVGVDDGGPGAVEAGGDGRLRRGARTQLFADTLVNQH